MYNCECRHPANCSVYQQHPDIDLIILQTFNQEKYMRSTVTAAARSRALREHRERTGFNNYDSQQQKKADSMLYLLKMFLTFGWVLVVSAYSFLGVVVASLTYTICIYWANRPETKLWLASLHAPPPSSRNENNNNNNNSNDRQRHVME